jgi:hypothetical protein
MNAANAIESKLKNLNKHRLFFASDWYQTHFKKMGISPGNYYKVLERLVKDNKILKLVKGLYYKPKLSRLGYVPLTEDQIIEFFIKNNKGVEVGYGLYNQKRLTTQLPRKRVFYLEEGRFQISKIKELTFIKHPIKFTEKIKNLTEILDVLENLDYLEEINILNLNRYLNDQLIHYNDQDLHAITNVISFKKSTLARLKEILDENGIKNTISAEYLSPLSKYKLLREMNISLFDDYTLESNKK